MFEQGNLPELINDTKIVLIPKKDNPEMIKDIRSIFLCSVIYKIFSKTLTIRMRMILQELIEDTQSAFVLGQLMIDNVLLTFDIVHRMKTVKRRKKCDMAVKIDVSKTYAR